MMEESIAPIGLSSFPEGKIPSDGLELAFYIDEEVKHLQKEIDRLQEQKKEIMHRYAAEGKWEEGNYRLKKQFKQYRTLDIDAFIHTYPDVANKLVKNTIRLPDADAELGKNRVTALCKVDTVTYYSVEYKPAPRVKE